MPTYQYACTACDERLEVVQKFTDDPLNECPACAGRLRKVFSAVGIVFKGSGFYRTDSRPEANGSKEGKGSKESKPQDSGRSSAGTTDSSAKAPAKSGAAGKAEAAA